MTVDYDAIAASYACNRRASEQVIAELRAFGSLAQASLVLEVGCGTANHISALVDAIGCGGWGIEPSDAMRKHARVRSQAFGYLTKLTGGRVEIHKAGFSLFGGTVIRQPAG